jgi:myo-inositol 2-dehydrogenase / D-chiro-inositol 1-dehydrogenase
MEGEPTVPPVTPNPRIAAMKARPAAAGPAASRRDFLRTSATALAGAALAGELSARAYAAEDNTVKVALVGCGGRGTGAAANALSTAGPTRLVALADVFDHRVAGSFGNLSKQFGEKVDVPEDRRFTTLDGYKKAIDLVAPGGVAILATPPAFRPIHLDYAVEKGCHVFMEKSFAVDGPGVRRVLAAGKKAEGKNLKIVGGLNQRHNRALQAAIEQIHQGAIGDVVACWAYRMHGPVGFSPRPQGTSELAHQIRNYSCFTWLNGSFLLDWLIHNTDVCCWLKDAWPVSAQGQGGRQVRTAADQLFDHYAVEYRFADGTRMLGQGRHMSDCWGFFGNVIHGATGCGVLGEGIGQPRLYKGHQPAGDNLLWEHKGPNPNSYQQELDVLFEAIRQDKPHNETERCAYAAMTCILGRMAAESGKEVTWEQALGSDLELAPGLEKIESLDDPAPVQADAEGNYPIAMPGITRAF